MNGAFEKLKVALTSSPILGYPSIDVLDGFILDTDALNCHIGDFLSQSQDGEEKVIAYDSKVLSSQEWYYCVTRRELLAVDYFIVYFKHYLVRRHFQLRTVHEALTWLFSFRQPEEHIARWLETLSEFNFNITHRPGRIHSNRMECQGDPAQILAPHAKEAKYLKKRQCRN